MRPSNKSRSRKGNRRQNSNANIVNRVFDSAGPEGKVRGTPQQIVEKYSLLARDAQLAGDRVAAESFMQHAEHYSRILAAAQAEQAARQAELAERHAEQQRQRNEQRAKQQAPKPETDPAGALQPDMDSEPAQLVETPENKPSRPRKPRPRKPAPPPEETSPQVAG